MRLVFDVDGVIADFDKAACAAFGPCDRRLYSLTDRWPHAKSAVNAFVTEMATYADLELVDGAQAGLVALAVAGHEIIMATARPGGLQMRALTIEWLRRHAIPFDDVFVVNTSDKANLIGGLSPDFAFDDAPHILNQLASRGVPAVVFAQPWNMSVSAEILRVDGWPSLVRLVQDDPQ